MSANNSRPEPRGKAARIVLVDDHPMVRERLADVINSQRDLQVCGEAEDPKSALEVIDRLRPNLVVLDLSLKEKFALELVGEIARKHPQVAILVLTMYESPLYAERALRSGALGYLTKRDATTKIIEAVRSVLRGEQYLSASVAARVMEALAGHRTGQSAVDHLSDRELTVLRMLGEGRPTRHIAETLGVDTRTVETYRSRIKDKVGLRDASDLLRFAIEWKSTGEGI